MSECSQTSQLAGVIAVLHASDTLSRHVDLQTGMLACLSASYLDSKLTGMLYDKPADLHAC